MNRDSFPEFLLNGSDFSSRVSRNVACYNRTERTFFVSDLSLSSFLTEASGAGSDTSYSVFQNCKMLAGPSSFSVPINADICSEKGSRLVFVSSEVAMVCYPFLSEYD
jgi:hypothetical protein